MPAVGRGFIERLEPPDFDNSHWTESVPLRNSKIAIVSTAAVSNRGDSPFSSLARDYLVIGNSKPKKKKIQIAKDLKINLLTEDKWYDLLDR